MHPCGVPRNEAIANGRPNDGHPCLSRATSGRRGNGATQASVTGRSVATGQAAIVEAKGSGVSAPGASFSVVVPMGFSPGRPIASGDCEVVADLEQDWLHVGQQTNDEVLVMLSHGTQIATDLKQAPYHPASDPTKRS